MSITIVTAFFDIGRSDWTTERGLPSYLERSTERYFSYFANLAKLDNHIVVFCEEIHKEKILQIRQEKSIDVVTIDFSTSFQTYRDKITQIQNHPQFYSKISPKQAKNPEYWSADYVLVTNLKTYFINQAIDKKLTKDELVAWVDFGYCRDEKTLENIQHWYYPFDKKYIHLFTLEPIKYWNIIHNWKFPNTVEKVKRAIFTNMPCIVGGVSVAAPQKWKKFAQVVKSCQHNLIEQNIIDDDQGVYLMCHALYPEMIQLHYLKKTRKRQPNWFGVFNLYNMPYLR